MDPYNNSQPNYFKEMPYPNNVTTPYANKAIDTVKGYYDPYTSYANDPEGFIARITESFKQDPGQIKANQEKLNAANNTAASQGRSMNPFHMRDQGDLASSLYSEQMQQYIKNILDQQNLGLNAAHGAAGDIGNIYNQEGAYAYQNERQKENDKRAFQNAIMQAFGTAGGIALGGDGGLGKKLAKLLGIGSGNNEDTQGYGFNNPGYSNYSSSYNTPWMNY